MGALALGMPHLARNLSRNDLHGNTLLSYPHAYLQTGVLSHGHAVLNCAEHELRKLKRGKQFFLNVEDIEPPAHCSPRTEARKVARSRA